MAISLDTTYNRSFAFGVSTLTYSITVASGATLLLAGVEIAGSPITAPTSVTFNGVAMSLLTGWHGMPDDSTSPGIGIYGLVSPASGTHDLVVNSGITGLLIVNGISLFGTSILAVPGVSYYNQGSTSTSLSLSPTVTDQSWIVGIGAADTFNVNVGSNLTTGEDGANPTLGYYGPKSGSGSITFSYTWAGSSASAMELVEVFPPVTGQSPGGYIGPQGFFRKYFDMFTKSKGGLYVPPSVSIEHA